MNEVTPILEEIKRCHRDLFDEKFLISKGHKIDNRYDEIVAPYGLFPKSIFLVAYNDKNAVDLSSEVVAILKKILMKQKL